MGIQEVIDFAATNSMSTGLLEGAAFSVNVSDNTKIDISGGTGAVIDNYTDPAKPVFNRVRWPNTTGITLTNLATSDLTWIGIDKDAQFVQQTTNFTQEQKRDIIQLGAIFHASRTQIDDFDEQAVFCFDALLNDDDFARTVSDMNFEGNVIHPTSNTLEISKTAGVIFSKGRGDSNKSINFRTTPSLNPVPFILYHYRDGGTGTGFVIEPPKATVDPNFYDFGGVKTPVPVLRWTVQRVWLDANNVLLFQYGQKFYQQFTSAIVGIRTERFEKNFNFQQTAFLGYYVVQQGATDLSNTVANIFVPAQATETGGNVAGNSESRVEIIANQNTFFNFIPSGSSDMRPIVPSGESSAYLDTDLDKLIININGVWRNADGSTLS